MSIDVETSFLWGLWAGIEYVEADEERRRLIRGRLDMIRKFRLVEAQSEDELNSREAAVRQLIEVLFPDLKPEDMPIF